MTTSAKVAEAKAGARVTCPYCGGEMVPGTATVAGTLLGFLFVGLSYQHLWFQRDDLPKQRIITSNDERPGHQCTECGAVLIVPTRFP
jgi:DNA-directed RNA polymerase subunit RPC12/RpoP